MYTKNKKAAVELSISTIVVIVIAMSMLILGLVLVKNIFTGATYNIDVLNEKVQGEMSKLFSDEEQKIVLYLPRDNLVKVDQGDDFGVGFAIRNTERGAAQASTFTFTVTAASVETGCDLTLDQANTYLRLGTSGSFDLSPGSDPQFRVVRLRPSDTAPLCLISYDIIVTKDGQSYITTFFDVQIT